ncbi:TPA: amino acid permease [Klebsiella variicola]|nr:amino acid permease [Klebsiella variicola]
MVSETKTTEAPTLRRELKARHLTMIAIGGSIGTGLFVASGATISQAGPGGALLSYILIGLMVYFLMTSLGELAAFMPVSGSFATYGQNYVEEGFGFALGWNYWYNWAVTIAVDLVASQLVMSYWFPDTPGWIWSALFLGIMFLLNWISVRGFGEAEYWFSLIKVATVIIFIIVGVMMIVGIFKGSQPTGWSNWGIADAPFAGGFSAMIGVAMIVGFSFQGTELIGIAAGESEDPEKNIPRAVRQVFWRILLFYVFAILIISLIIPYTDPSLLRNDVKDISVSPFTLVFQHAGLLSAAAIMNAVILTAVLSAGNSGMTGFIAWLGIAISHYRFRRGYVMQGNDINNLPYRSGFFPLGPIFAFVLCLIITLGQNYEAFLKDTIDWGGVAATYIGIPLFLVIWFGYKLAKGTRFVRYSEMTFPDRFKR